MKERPRLPCKGVLEAETKTKKRVIFPELRNNISFYMKMADQRKNFFKRPRLKCWLNFRIPCSKVSIKFFTQLIHKAEKLNHSY